MLNDSHLLHLNQLGIIPGPDEQEEDFLKRADQCLHLAQTLASAGEPAGFSSAQDLHPQSVLEGPFVMTSSLFDMAPDWVPLFFSNRGLALWHGGCAWICQLSEESQPVGFLQIRRWFADHLSYLGLYDRNELLAHELAHIGRMTFQEPIYEEVLAYRTSKSAFRRWLGPIVTSGREAAVFLLVLLLLIIVDIATIMQPGMGGWKIALGLKLIPITMVALALCRLWLRQRKLSCCLLHLNQLFNHEGRANAVLYRLTDAEIRQFAQLTPQDILHYAHDAGPRSLRWRLLVLAYFSKIVPA